MNGNATLPVHRKEDAITSTQWQLAREAAERYEDILVPSILGPAAAALVQFAAPQPGEMVIDVGCGTGAAARYAAASVKGSGRVIGIDVNAGMLETAQARTPSGVSIEWQQGNATALPLPDESIDLVLCAQTLQFLSDRPAALREMQRVLRRGGRVAVSTWSEIGRSPYFAVLVDATTQHVGPETAIGLRSAFTLPDGDALAKLLGQAGFGGIEVTEAQLDLALPPLSEFVPLHVSATPMAAGFAAATPEARAAVVEQVARELAQYRTRDGVTVPFRTLLARAKKSATS